jgi:hypothetical protein
VSEPEKCKACDGNGILLGRKATNGNGSGEAPKKRLPYYPERYMLSRDETLDEWKADLEKDVAKKEAEIEKLRGGIDQINGELAKRAMGKVKEA